MRSRKTNILIVMAICISMTVASVAGAYAATSSQKKQEASVWGKKAENALALTKDAEEKAAVMQDSVDAKKVQIKQTEAKVAAKQKEIDDQTEALNERLNVMYKTGTVGFVDVVLSSDSVSDLLMNVGLVQKILKNDQELLEKMQDDLKELKALKTQLEKEKAELDKQMEELKSYIASKKAEADKDRQMQKQLENEAAALYQKEMAAIAAAEAAKKKTNIPSAPPSSGGGNYVWPTQGTITSEYGYRICPFHGQEFHNGLDIARYPAGTPVYAIAAGVVGTASWSGGYGNCVTISHGGSMMSLYGHLQSIAVSSGQSVSKGQLIGYMGSTGNSTGPHLHFTVYKNGVTINPHSLY